MLGKGSYGDVHANGNVAVKTFTELPHLLQEHVVGSYLQGCDYVLRTHQPSLSDMTLAMELYDCSMSEWLATKPRGPLIKEAFKSVLKGLMQLHTIGLTHGDLKPSNILVRKAPFKVVLGDLGFTSLSEYAKCRRTAPIYRDPKVIKAPSHDMYSFGIILLKHYAAVKSKDLEGATYTIVKRLTKRIKNRRIQKLTRKLTRPEHHKRPSARETYKYLFRDEARVNIIKCINTKYQAHEPILARLGSCREGRRMSALLYKWFLDRPTSLVNSHVHIAAARLLASSLYGPSNWGEREACQAAGCSTTQLHQGITELLSSESFRKGLLTPESGSTYV